jgi:hypothetical protein
MQYKSGNYKKISFPPYIFTQKYGTHPPYFHREAN